MTRPVCEWLHRVKIKAVGYDFPQDYPIRSALDKEVARFLTLSTHDVLLRNGVTMIEYLVTYTNYPPYTHSMYSGRSESDGAPLARLPFQPEDKNTPRLSVSTPLTCIS